MAILERRHDDVEVSGEVCENQFSILASAEAFEILSDRIYPNKIKAVVRELSTNAVDATVDARKVSVIHQILNENPLIDLQFIANRLNENLEYVQKERSQHNLNGYDLSNWVEQPPVVHLPNLIEPWFSIRDFGTGLAHDVVMKLYTTYFWSDKKTSNDYTGCLGLGSKSPFAYTDSFTVTSYFNGEKRMYNAHLKNGFPSITIFLDDAGQPLVFPTDEPNGLEVMFPVRASDITEFANEATRLYPNFKMRLEIVGNTYVKNHVDSITKAKADGTYYSLSNDETIQWGFRRKNENGEIGPQAIMGNIAYPIKLTNIYDLDSVVQQVHRSNIDIVFPIGSLQITPSREQLSYKQSTIDAIKTAFETVGKEFSKKLSDKIADAETLWDARLRVVGMLHEDGLQGLVNLLSASKLTWNGQEIGPTQWVTFEDPEKSGITIHRFDHMSTRKNMRQEIRNFPIQRDLNIYEVDLPKGSFTRCEIESRLKGKTIYALEFANKAARTSFFAKLGLPDTTTYAGTSSLPKPTAKTKNVYSSDSQIYLHTGDKYGNRQYKFWEDVSSTFKLDDGGVYVEMLRYKILHDGKDLHPEAVGRIIEHIKEIDSTEFDVIGVRRRMVKQFKRSDDWVDLITYAKNVIKTNVLKNNIDVSVADQKLLSETKYMTDFENLYQRIYNKVPEGPFKDFLLKVHEVWESASKVNSTYNTYTDLATQVNYKFDASPTHEIKNEMDTVIERYPMLGFALSNGYSGSRHFDLSRDTEVIVKYVESLDK